MVKKIGGAAKKVFVIDEVQIDSAQIQSDITEAISDSPLPNTSFGLDVATNQVSTVRQSVVRLGDMNSKTTARLVWHVTQADDYTFLVADTDLFLSSTSVSDVGNTMRVVGTDITGQEVAGIIALNGQSQVQLPQQFFRVNETQNIGTTALVGEVYLAEADTLTLGVPDTVVKIKDKIDLITDFTIPRSQGSSQTGVYTVPNILLDGSTVVSAGVVSFAIYPDDAFEVITEVRVPGIAPFVINTIQNGSGSNVLLELSQHPFPLPPGTTFLIYAAMGSPNQTVTATIFIHTVIIPV